MKILFFGTPKFAADVLDYLLSHQVAVAAVFTKPDKPKGRSGNPVPTPVKAKALAHGLPVHQPEIVSAAEIAPQVAAYNADLFVVVAYGEILKQHLLDMPKIDCINLHASLLPKYRGAAPIQRSIIAGEQETGVTIMHMVKKMDAGDIIKLVKVPIGIDTTYGELEHALCIEGSKLLLEVIRDFEKGTSHRTPQEHDKATLAPKIELEECQIDWTQSAQALHNLIRGVFPFPGAWCWVKIRGQPLRLKVFKTRLRDLAGTPGSLLSYGKEGLIIACGKDSLEILELQLEGKKAMKAEELMRGIPKDLFLINQQL
jgi:methionyl-tRNA formyltransferase